MARYWTGVLQHRGGLGLAANIVFAISLACLANVLVFLVNPAEQLETPVYRFQPPGFVIGLVWVLLFAAMGFARWLVLPQQDGGLKRRTSVLLLIVFCAAYPLYTLGLRSMTLGLAGNAVTAALAIWVASRIRRSSWLAAGMVLAPAVWVAFASYLILEQILGRSI